jgi:hypothetical protein
VAGSGGLRQAYWNIINDLDCFRSKDCWDVVLDRSDQGMSVRKQERWGRIVDCRFRQTKVVSNLSKGRQVAVKTRRSVN